MSGKKNGSVGRDLGGGGLMHILAVIMLHQHELCVYNGKRKLKLPITCANFVLFALNQFLLSFVNIYF